MARTKQGRGPTTSGPAAAAEEPALATDPRLRLAAEAFGTFVLVFTGAGTAVLALTVAKNGVQIGVGVLGVALAFGLAVLVMSAVLSDVSGAHLNPAVTVGLACAGRFRWRDVPGYVVAQLVGSAIAAAVLFAVATGAPGFDATTSGFASNGYGAHSPGGYDLGAALLVEAVLTAVFVAVVLVATGPGTPKATAPVVVGLALALTNLVAAPVDDASVNPARSFGVALFAGPDAIGQLWVFLLAPLIGGAVAGLVHRALARQTDPAPR